MKLRNKKTGEIGTLYQNGEGVFYEIWVSASGHKYLVDSLAELNEEWEDYEEPKEQYYIKENGDIGTCGAIEDDIPDEMFSEMKSIGNYFETEEEAEKAVEKLKAWKRLKDKGFKFVGWEDANNDVNDILFELPYMEWDKNVCDDLDLLFGGER